MTYNAGDNQSIELCVDRSALTMGGAQKPLKYPTPTSSDPYSPRVKAAAPKGTGPGVSDGLRTQSY